jgi:hypothetical protein
MQELEAILQKQEKRMETQRKNTPAKVAAMNRERRWLQTYNKQARAASAVHSASLDMMSAMTTLQQSLTPRAGDSCAPLCAPTVVRSWLRWAHSAMDYGLEMWRHQVLVGRENHDMWSNIVFSMRCALVKEVMASLQHIIEEKRNQGDAQRAAKLHKEARIARVIKACELYCQSEAGKIIMHEATQHWNMTGVLCAMVGWMKEAQVRLVQQCLMYSGKMHWHMYKLTRCFTSWRQISRLQESAFSAQRKSMVEFRQKARRLSLQSDRCSQKLLRHRQDRRLSYQSEESRMKDSLHTLKSLEAMSQTGIVEMNAPGSPLPMSPAAVVA